MDAVLNYKININDSKKCAEIYCSTHEFSIVCFLCQQMWYNYDEYIYHYQEKHESLTSLQTRNESLQSSLDYQLRADFSNGYQENEDLLRNNKSYQFNFMEDKEISETDQTDIGEKAPTTYTQSEDDLPLYYSPTHLNGNQKRPYKPRNQPNRCHYCAKTFRRRYQLDTHLNIHTGVKPYQCDICGRQFRAINTLQRHLNTHGKRETFTCKYCDKEFAHRAAYVSHETRHTQERQVPCEDCGKLFYTRNQLDTHRRKKHNTLGDTNLPYACDLCCKKYRSASMLSTHKLKKHFKTAKFVCEKCSKKFVSLGKLNEHMSIHVIQNDTC